jgi:hypothetical protein
MSSASQNADPAANDVGGSAPSQLQLLQRLQTLELQADLDAQNIAQLREQNTALEDAFSAERARGEKHAEAFMRIARTCDDRVEELKAQYAGVVAKLENEKVALKAAHAAAAVKTEEEKAIMKAATAATISKLEAGKASLEAQVAVLQAQTTSKLMDIHAAIAAMHTPLPPPPPQPPLLLVTPMTFDRDWCAAARGSWITTIDAATGTRASAEQDGAGWLTLRSAAPLPRRPSSALAGDGRQQHRLPAYRVVIEECNSDHVWILGFLPSHYSSVDAGAAAAVTPITRREISRYGGWHIDVVASSHCLVPDAKWSGWVALQPSDGAAGDASSDTSAYATTDEVPPVPEGSAVEFAVDYAAGTCRVAFYTRTAVAGGFVKAPYAKMELRFVATEATSSIPARPIPTLADSGVELYPVVCTGGVVTAWRFVF